MIKIKDKVKSLIEEEGYTVTEIADILGVSASQVAKYRQGVTQIPRIEVAINIYLAEQVVIFPYSQEALQELIKDIAMGVELEGRR